MCVSSIRVVDLTIQDGLSTNMKILQKDEKSNFHDFNSKKNLNNVCLANSWLCFCLLQNFVSQKFPHIRHCTHLTNSSLNDGRFSWSFVRLQVKKHHHGNQLHHTHHDDMKLISSSDSLVSLGTGGSSLTMAVSTWKSLDKWAYGNFAVLSSTWSEQQLEYS